MWSFDLTSSIAGRLVRLGAIAMALTLAACTVEPLNATRSDSSLALSTPQGGVTDILAGTEVDFVSDRVAQQVRNNLLFALNGGSRQPDGKYRIKLAVETKSVNLAVENDSRAPTARQIRVISRFFLIDKENGKTVYQGRRQAAAAYNATSQVYANERAKRDAENRAAEDLARQIRVDVAQAVASS